MAKDRCKCFLVSATELNTVSQTKHLLSIVRVLMSDLTPCPSALEHV